MKFIICALAFASIVSAGVSELFNTDSYRALAPENFEFDPMTNTLLFGSTTQGGLYRALPDNPFNPITFVQPSQMAFGNFSMGVTGVKIRRKTNAIYALVVYNMPNFGALRSRLMVFDGYTGATIKHRTIEAIPALLNDLVIDEENGVLYVTQSVANGQVYVFDLDSLSYIIYNSPLYSLANAANQSPVGMNGIVYDSKCKVLVNFNVKNQTLLRSTGQPFRRERSTTIVGGITDSLMIDGMIMPQRGLILAAVRAPYDQIYVIKSSDCWSTASVIKKVKLGSNSTLVDVTMDPITRTVYATGDRVYKLPADDLYVRNRCVRHHAIGL